MSKAATYQDVVRPFADVYQDVTHAIRAHQVYTHGPASAWVQALVRDFESEYQQWPVDVRYARYVRLCRERLRAPMLRLAALAFLHISYDLPRVIANHWSSVSEEDAERAYFALTPVFFRTFGHAVRRWHISGVFSLAAGLAPERALGTLAIWALHLRTAAWVHARRLPRGPTLRPPHHPRMLHALTISLIEVLRRPWSVGLVSPPHSALAVVPIGGLLIAFDHWWVGAAVAAVVLWGVIAAQFRARNELAEFIQQLSEAIATNVSLAVNDPEAFDLVAARFASEVEALDSRALE